MARLLRSLFSRIDGMVARLENHDAQLERALGDERERLARVERQLERARERHAVLDESWRAAIEQQQGWRERARTEVDEAVALECLRSSRGAAQRAASTSEQCHQQAELGRRLEALLARLRDRLSTLEGQRALLRCREADVAFARAVPPPMDVDRDLQALLDRWERSVGSVGRELQWLPPDEGELGAEHRDDGFLKLELYELRRDRK